MLRYAWLVVIFLGLLGCRRTPPPEPEPVAPVVQPKEVQPFLVQVDTAETSVVQGAKAKVKVSILRKGYPGPITLELRNLPGNVTAAGVVIPGDKNAAEIEVAAGLDAAPGKTTNAVIVGTANFGGQKVVSPHFTLTVREMPFSLRVEPTPIKIQQGTRLDIKVVAERKGYQGPIALDFRNLPAEVKISKTTIPAGRNSVLAEIQAGPKAMEGEKTNVQVVGTPTGISFQANSPKFSVVVQGLPFTLQTREQDILIPYGAGKAKLKVSATRRDYQGPITLELINLPSRVSAEPVQIGEGQTSAEMQIVVAENAPGAKSKEVQVKGVASAASNPRHSSSPKIALGIEGPPFEIRLEPSNLDVVQGAATPWKIAVIRKGYDGPIKVELRNLPKEISADAPLIMRGNNSGKIEVKATDQATGDKSGIQVVGTALALENKQVTSTNFGLRVLEPFSLQVEPASVQLVEGGKATFKVNAIRRSYQGPIEVAVNNLPAKVSAGPATVPEGKDSVEVEVTAAASAGGGTRNDVQVVGTATNSRKALSPPFTVALQSKLFELKIRPDFLALAMGEKTTLKVLATRRNYQGPIVLELKNLPAQVTTGKVTLPKDATEGDFEVAAGLDASPTSRQDVHVLGTATAGGNQQVASANFRLDIKQGMFDLKADPALLKLTHGAVGKLKVTAQRKGYKGAINVELRNLPTAVKATPATINPDANDTEIEVKADFAAVEGDTVDVQVKGYITLTEKPIFSPRFIVSVGSYGQPPALEVKLDPTDLKIPQGGSAKLKVNLVRKSHDGPVNVELKNLPPGLESTKATIEQGKTTGEITLTAKTNAELGVRSDICALAGATIGSETKTFASRQLTVQVLRK